MGGLGGRAWSWNGRSLAWGWGWEELGHGVSEREELAHGDRDVDRWSWAMGRRGTEIERVCRSSAMGD